MGLQPVCLILSVFTSRLQFSQRLIYWHNWLYGVRANPFEMPFGRTRKVPIHFRAVRILNIIGKSARLAIKIHLISVPAKTMLPQRSIKYFMIIVTHGWKRLKPQSTCQISCHHCTSVSCLFMATTLVAFILVSPEVPIIKLVLSDRMITI